MATPAPITIPTEPIGSIPRPVDRIEGVAKGDGDDPNLAPLYEEAIRDTIERVEATGSPVVAHGERIPDYSREQFIEDLLSEHEIEIRRCLNKGAHKVQVDFAEGRLALKIDPSGALLCSFIDLINNLALSRFSPEERRSIGVHTCPGNDLDSTHSGDVEYAKLLPSLFELKTANFYIALAGERDRRHALKIIRKYRKRDQRIFVGVTAPVDPHIEIPEEVRDRSFEPGKNWRWC
jgi:5-methyltetrahydropteroyltriglutamate--homocysteine methyltransferase